MIKNFGWIHDSHDERDRIYNSRRSQNLADHVDFRSRFPKAWDQGALNSCTAHAVGAACLYRDIYDDDRSITVPSLLYIYYMTRALEGSIGIDSGATIRNTVKAAKKFGYPVEDAWPYQVAAFAARPRDEVITSALRERVSTYERLPRDVVRLKEALSEHSPIVLGFTVFESIYGRDVDGTGIIPKPKRNEKIVGGHAVLACGYDDARESLIIRNSWGTDWGEDGYGYLPYTFIENPKLSADFWTIR